MIKLRPCPFCGGIPKLYGRERRDYIESDDEWVKENTDNGWAKKTAKEYWVKPFCQIGCFLGSTHATAFGIVDGITYITPEAAAAGWNERYDDV